MDERDRARELADEHGGDPTEWFETLYAEGVDGDVAIPWADREPNPNLVEWFEDSPAAPDGGSALVVGCGLGDDAEALSARGFDVTAFDVSPTAIERCRERFPESTVTYRVSDLFDPPDDWTRSFGFVLESYTLQTLPRPERRAAVEAIAEFVAPGGTLLVVCRGRDDDEPEGELPWPLAKAEVLAFADEGLDPVSFEDYLDDETPPVRRFRAAFRRS